MIRFLFMFLTTHAAVAAPTQTVHNRQKMLLEKAQEESTGTVSAKLSLKATLTDQIKEQENIVAALKEVRKGCNKQK